MVSHENVRHAQKGYKPINITNGSFHADLFFFPKKLTFQLCTVKLLRYLLLLLYWENKNIVKCKIYFFLMDITYNNSTTVHGNERPQVSYCQWHFKPPFMAIEIKR